MRVWLLSDVALVDRFGQAALIPAAAMLGLPEGGIFQPQDSAIATRRYAPWNGALKARDIERQVIAAGSVLTFFYKGGAPEWDANRPAVAGLWQEAGLGRLWIDPPLLRAEGERHCRIGASLAGEAITPEGSEPKSSLAGWLADAPKRRSLAGPAQEAQP